MDAFNQLSKNVGDLPSRSSLNATTPYPGGINPRNPDFGELMQWSKFQTKTGDQAGAGWAAIKAIEKQDAAYLKSKGMTSEIAEHWRDLYIAASREGRGVGTAEPRAILMDYVANLLR